MLGLNVLLQVKPNKWAKKKQRQGCHIWVGSKFPDISLTIPWHIAIFPWQFILFLEIKNKVCPEKQLKIPVEMLIIFP